VKPSRFAAFGFVSVLVLSACGNGGPAYAAQTQPAQRAPVRCDGPGAAAGPGMTPAVPGGLSVPAGFTIETIARIGGARELAALPDGDLIVGTKGSDVYIVPDAESAGAAGSPLVFATFDDAHASGVAFARDRCTLLFGSEHGVWSTPYASGDLTAEKLREIAKVRQGAEAPNTDGDVHVTTSVAYWNGVVYASAGSSCNAYEYPQPGVKAPCKEVDPTRAAISQMRLDGSQFAQRAFDLRNAIALTIDPVTGALWAGDAGQDALPFGHPYEFLDDVSAHPGDADYGWPKCEENHHAYWPHADCSQQAVPRIELPAYSTIVGNVFYPLGADGRFAFPTRYRGALFVATHGSWHRSGGAFVDAPQVDWVPMNGDQPATPVDWNDPAAQWHPFVTGFQTAGYTRVGRATGVAVGSKGSLFIADDQAGAIYRVRPAAR